jgi:hypothetical protein
MELTELELSNWESKRFPDIFINKDHPNYSDFSKRIKSNDWDFYTIMNRENLRLKPGSYFLYERVEPVRDSNKGVLISYPRLGIYLHEYMVDMTTEVEWVDVRRSYEWRLEIKDRLTLSDDRETKIQRQIQWDSFLMVSGAWKNYPNWKELKEAWKRTWHSYEPVDILRERKLNFLIK